MTWHQGFCPWNDPVSEAQERTEAMLRREYTLLAMERLTEHQQGATDDGQTEIDPDQRP